MQRLVPVDVLRAMAVIAMVTWHTADGWLSPEFRSGPAWTALLTIGGLAAPLFLWLAGASVALQLARRRRDEPVERAYRQIALRAAQLVVLGYLLRVQCWALDMGAITTPSSYPALVPLASGLAILLLAIQQAERLSSDAGRWLLLGLSLVAVGLGGTAALAPHRLPTLLKLDILHAIGCSILCLLLLDRWFGAARRAAPALAAAALTALCTAWAWHHLPALLPDHVAVLLARLETPSTHVSVSRFPLFPWAAYTFFGAVWGQQVYSANTPKDQWKIWLGGGLLGILLLVSTSEYQPPVYRCMRAYPESVQPLRVVFRCGAVLVLTSLAWLLARTKPRNALVRAGRASLRIYWLHLIFAYGIAGRSLAKTCAPSTWVASLVLLSGALYAATWISWPRSGWGERPKEALTRT